jgi:MFS family permease
MLASITPLGERGRHSRWGVTVGAFLLGATAAGTGAGAALGTLGGLVLADGWRTRLAVLAGALALAIAVDVSGRVPGPRRQVDERWLDRYRGWVYGIGYGSQLGLAVTTVVSSAATYVALLTAFLVGRPGLGAVIVGAYGAVRGLTPLATAGVRNQGQLLLFHRTLSRWRSRARWGAVAAQAGGLVLAVALTGA